MLRKFYVEVFDNEMFNTKVFEVKGKDTFHIVRKVASKIDLNKERIVDVKEVKEQ